MSFTHRLILASALAAAPLTLACSSTVKYAVQGTDTAPGADAEVEVEPGESGNYEVRIKAKNLLPPDRVKGAKFYAVWVKPAGKESKHIGNLEYDADDRSGTFKSLTTHKAFTLQISAERESAPSEPGGAVVFKQKVAVE